MSKTDNSQRSGKPKKKWKWSKRILYAFIGLFLFGLIGHTIQYATDNEYAQRVDAREAERKAERQAEEQRRAEEKRLAEARKAEEAHLAALKKAEEERQAEIARQEAEEAKRLAEAKTETETEMFRVFFTRSKEVRLQAQERLREGKSRAGGFVTPIPMTITPEDEATVKEAKQIFNKAYGFIEYFLKDDKFNQGEFKPGERDPAILKTTIELLQSAQEQGTIPNAVLAEILWLQGICLVQLGWNDYENISPSENNQWKQAKDVLSQSAKLGSNRAKFALVKLGLLCGERGLEDRFDQLLDELVEQKYPPAMVYDSFMRFADKRDNPETWEPLLELADQDYPPAQRRVSDLLSMFVANKLPKQSDEVWDEASAWTLLAAENGFSSAQYSMGPKYEKNDPTEAVRWFDLASKQHNGDAYYKLGLCYINGTGVGKDIEKGKRYLLFAARRLGSTNAKKYLEKAHPGLSAKQRTILAKVLPAHNPLLQPGSTWQPDGEPQKVKNNFSIFYFKNALNERCSLFWVGHLDGGEYAKTIFVGESGDPLWSPLFDGSDYRAINMGLQSGIYTVLLVFSYDAHFLQVELQPTK